jgi:sugar phosphate isomerase/epimerase
MNALSQNQRLIALAAGVVQEFPPDQVVYAAAEAGFNAVGIWCDLDIWTDEHTDKVCQALTETGITALDIEVVWFQPGEPIDTHNRFVDIAKAIGAKNILCVSSEPDISETKRRFKHLCQLTEGSDIRVVLEFLAITEIDSLAKALEVVEDIAHPAGGILVDALHLQRTGSCAQDIVELAQARSASPIHSQTRLFPYLQLCDACENLEDQSYEGILEDAIFLRKLLGEGELPLKDILQAVDADTPLSLEIRSRALAEQFPGLQERANAVFENTQKYLTPRDIP